MPPREANLRGWLLLARCPKLPPRDAFELVERVGSVEPFAAPYRERLLASGVPPPLAARLAGPRLGRRVDAELRFASSRGWTLVDVDDERYPAPLRSISVPPLVVAVRGDVACLARTSIAVVGSRRPTAYGLIQAERLAGPLAAAGLPIVSGLARGIDAAAHRAALDHGGPTVAVLGTGLDRVYPAEHDGLLDRIAGSGAVLSEFPPGTPPKRNHFPRRNRLIAGLALAVVVVEAAERSGSLVTARWAAEEGRSVLAVPGRAGEPTSAGTLGLLRDGAALACTPEDVLDEIPPELRPETACGDRDARDGHHAQLAARLALIDDLAPAARSVLDRIPLTDDVLVDDLVETVRAPFEEVQAGLFGLELAGLVESLPGGRFRRVSRP
ncbi:MAG: DNA-processing protein DprA [Acidobacteriota bacterium]|nr:DNA-processing protein DprA [Acidobacteriota bacterium]